MKARNPIAILFMTMGLTIATWPVKAEEAKPAGSSSSQHAEVQTAIFKMEHADVYSIQRLVSHFQDFFSGSIKVDADSRTIVVVGSKEMVSACAEAIKRLDVPPKPAKNIELTFYILVASKKAIPGGECPPAIQSFCSQMKGIFKGFQLLETVSMRTREGKMEAVSGVIAASGVEGESMPYKLRFGPVELVADGKDAMPIIRTWIKFTTSINVKQGSTINEEDVGFDTNVDIREGQEVGITTVSRGTPGESLCIVAKAKIVD